MILLLGKSEAINRYAKEVLNIDAEKDIIYYPSTGIHYSEFPKYINLVRGKESATIATQNLEVIDTFLNSDLEFEVITAFIVDGELKSRVLLKEQALYAKNNLGLELR